jgi:hypothetical protein
MALKTNKFFDFLFKIKITEWSETMVNKKNKTIFGIFRNNQEIKSTLKDLMNEGFDRSDISVLVPTSPHPDTENRTAKVVGGGILGAIISVTIIMGSGMNIPLGKGRILAGIGLFLLSLLGVMTGVLVVRALVGYGPSDEPVIKYSEVLKKGGHLLSIHIRGGADKAYKALEILKNHQAKHISLQNNTIEKSKWKIEEIS